MLAGVCVGALSDPELKQLGEHFERSASERPELSITEDLHRTLLHYSDPGESEAVEPSDQRVERVLENIYGSDGDKEFAIAPELLGALKQPSLC